MPEIPKSAGNNSVSESSLSPSDLGIAVDVGTTTVVVSVWSLSARKHLATVAEKNNQVRYGYDVIKRISFACRPPLTGSSMVVESGPSALHYCILMQLEKMVSKAVAIAGAKLPRGFHPRINSIVITGNTVMLSFVCAVTVKNMAAAPFAPGSLFDFTTTWHDVREGKACENTEELDNPTAEMLSVFKASIIPEDTPVYFPPCIGAFIGADTICSMISAGFPVPGSAQTDLQPGESPLKVPLLLADIGTNSEIVLYEPGSEKFPSRIFCTSAAAGPAFEAANIACGMSAVEGAIDKISIEGGKIIPHVIGNVPAKGICGSGLVSIISKLYENNYIEKSGAILKGKSLLGDGSVCIEITPAVYISQQDIRNLQLAKSAVRTGLEYMVEKADLIPVFCIAGGFGAKIDLQSAKKIGLYPSVLEQRVVQIGNGALAGASSMLFSKALREKARQLKKHSFPINLAAIHEFQTRFLHSIDFS